VLEASPLILPPVSYLTNDHGWTEEGSWLTVQRNVEGMEASDAQARITCNRKAFAHPLVVLLTRIVSDRTAY